MRSVVVGFFVVLAAVGLMAAAIWGAVALMTWPYHPITNQEIIDSADQCQAAGFKAVAVRNGFGEIYRVECEPWENSGPRK